MCDRLCLLLVALNVIRAHWMRRGPTRALVDVEHIREEMRQEAFQQQQHVLQLLQNAHQQVVFQNILLGLLQSPLTRLPSNKKQRHTFLASQETGESITEHPKPVNCVNIEGFSIIRKTLVKLNTVKTHWSIHEKCFCLTKAAVEELISQYCLQTGANLPLTSNAPATKINANKLSSPRWWILGGKFGCIDSLINSH